MEPDPIIENVSQPDIVLDFEYQNSKIVGGCKRDSFIMNHFKGFQGNNFIILHPVIECDSKCENENSLWLALLWNKFSSLSVIVNKYLLPYFG